MTEVKPTTEPTTVGARSAERQAIQLGFEAARRAFSDLLVSADEEDLGRSSNGTRWTNRQLLFHMLFGYLVVKTLVPLVKVFSRLPDVVDRRAHV